MVREPSVNVDRLNQLMVQRGLGPGELAYLSGVGYDTIYKVRATERPRTSAEIVGKLAQALGCSVDYLLGMTDNPTPYSSGAVYDVEAFLLIVGNLSPTRRHELLQIAEALARVEKEEQARIEHNLKLNRQLLDLVREVGGDSALDELFTLIGEPAGLDRTRLLGLLASEQPEKEEKD